MSASAPAALPVPDAAGIPAWLTVLIAAPCGLLVGLGSVAVQILVRYAAHLAPDAHARPMVRNVVSGLILGIMRARQVASPVTEALSWQAVFARSAAVMAGLAVVLRLALPPRQPAPGLRYAALLASMSRLALRTPVLQRRALYQACLFAAFSLFWKAAALFLADTFHLSQNGTALFALVGVPVQLRRPSRAGPPTGAGAGRRPALPCWACACGGWSLAMWAGLVLPMLAFCCFLTERPDNFPNGDDA